MSIGRFQLKMAWLINSGETVIRQSQVGCGRMAWERMIAAAGMSAMHRRDVCAVSESGRQWASAIIAAKYPSTKQQPPEPPK